MKNRLAVLFVLAASAFASETREPAAVAVARRTVQAMGGEQAFAKLRTLKFDFVVEREGKETGRIHHVWDRWDGRYRIERLNREGRHVLTLFNVQKPGVGRSWLDGEELTGDVLKKALETAYGRFINDTYWLRRRPSDVRRRRRPDAQGHVLGLRVEGVRLDGALGIRAHRPGVEGP
jgi:hypothetical protein